MHYRLTITAISVALFTTAAISAPIAEPHSLEVGTRAGELVAREVSDALVRRVSPGELTKQYHDHETAAKSHLDAAQDLHAKAATKGLSPTEKSALKNHVQQAYNQGHQAEKKRLDYVNTFKGGKIDDQHAQAIQHIDNNIMQPAQSLADFHKVSVKAGSR